MSVDMALRNLDGVVREFPEASRAPIQDLILRGVTPEALDAFIEECMMTGVNSGVPPDQIWPMIARSCFHMGMLTENYLNKKGGDVQKEEAAVS